jgi:hypothetical protein
VNMIANLKGKICTQTFIIPNSMNMMCNDARTLRKVTTCAIWDFFNICSNVLVVEKFGEIWDHYELEVGQFSCLLLFFHIVMET